MKTSRIIQHIIVFALFILLWKGIIYVFNFKDFILPQPENVLTTYIRLISDGTLIHHTIITLKETLLGFFIGSFIGALIGYFIGKIKSLESFLSPYIISIQSIPVIAIAPLLAVWFGYGIASKIIICSIIVFFPILINTMTGIKNISQKSKELFQLLRADKYQNFTKLELPSLMIVLFASFKIGILFSIIGAIVGEFTGASEGLGYLILYSSNMMRTSVTFATLLQLSIVGIVLYYALVILEKKLLSPIISSKLEKVTVIFPYLLSAEVLPICTAINNKYYEDEGLNVKIDHTPNGSLASIRQVAEGKADFCYPTGGESLIIARDKGLPIVAVYQSDRVNSFGIITKKNSGITSPQQLIGKSIATAGPGCTADVSAQAILKNSGVDISKVKFIYVGSEIVKSLLSGDVDAIAGHPFYEELFKSMGIEINSFYAKDYETNFPAGLIVTSEKMIRDKEDTVTRFIRATDRGLRYAINNSTVALDDYIKNFNVNKIDNNKSVESNYWNRSLSDQFQSLDQLGHLDRSQFNSANETIHKMGLINDRIDIDRAYTDEFTS